MDLRGLRYFVAAVDSGSITGPQSVAMLPSLRSPNHLKTGEDELGFDCSPEGKRGVEPTLDGQALYACPPAPGTIRCDYRAFPGIAPHVRLYVRQEIVLPIQRMRVLLKAPQTVAAGIMKFFGRSMEQADPNAVPPRIHALPDIRSFHCGRTNTVC